MSAYEQPASVRDRRLSDSEKKLTTTRMIAKTMCDQVEMADIKSDKRGRRGQAKGDGTDQRR